MLPKNWIISKPMLDYREREILFITAKAAGFVVYKGINDKLIEPRTEPYWSSEYMIYICCDGIFMSPCALSNKPNYIKVDYEYALERLRDIIRAT